MYEHMCLLEYGPKDKLDRRYWIEKLQCTNPVMLYTHHCGNYLGNIHFIWKIPECEDERNDSDNLDVLFDIRKYIPIYHTRAMRHAFMDRYAQLPAMKPAILRDVYRFLTLDASAADTKEQAEVDDRVAQFLLHSDDPALFYDLRANNGRPVNKNFDPFWDEMQKYLDEQSVVHERRHGQHLYMPFAISVEDLVGQITKRLPAGAYVPSTSTVRMNFWPANPYTKSAVKYSGRFNVKYAVQQRLLRSQHPDAAYGLHQFRLLKAMSVRYREHAVLVCMDDKATVPVGEPGNPISTGVRAHNRSLTCNDVPIVALDHDFHLCGLVPSVVMEVDIPENGSDSFHSGKVHVTVKDKIYEPSSAVRHATETLSILRRTENDVNMDEPMLFIYTDGGPDHRSTYWSVHLSLMLLFIALDLDILVSARTAPCQSYNNPAERIMSLLNLALQNVAIARTEMSAASELRMKSLSTMKKIRQLNDQHFHDQLKESMAPVITLLKERFKRLKKQEEPVQVHNAATSKDIDELCKLLNIFDVSEEETGIPFANLKSRKDLTKYPCLGAFYHNHCRQRHYTFQIMKCLEESCTYCTLHPPRLPEETFATLSWLPDPVFGPNKEYRNFEDVYGTDTTDEDRPSLKLKPKPPERDVKHKKLLVSAKVRGFIICSECGKRRCYYSALRLNRRQVTSIDRVQEELLFTCGGTLFPEDPLRDTIVVKEGQTCESTIETAYYAGINFNFSDICVHCGDNNDMYEGPEVEAAKRGYGIVRPICIACHATGKGIIMRSALKLKKRH